MSSSALPLRKVVVYRNGVGYFERDGHVDSDTVSFQVRPSHVGDFLATLAVMEKAGSSVRSVSFPIREQPAPKPPEPDAESPPSPPAGLETVTLTLDGKSHDLAVGYVSEQPMWRPSYRVVLNREGATLQAWGIVQNLSGEDWKDVTLSLVAGAPIAFQSTLATPVTPLRPILTDNGETITQVPVGQNTVVASAPQAFANKKAFSSLRAPEREPDEASAEAPRTPSVQVQAQVASSLIAGTTRYDVPTRVTIPKDSATMVLLLSEAAVGESNFMFSPDPGVPDSATHPFRVVRLVNPTSGLLERGPVAIFENSAFLGQGVLEPLSAGGRATIPFALDRSVAVQTEHSERYQGARIAQIEAGRLTVERDRLQRTVYRMQNGSAASVKLLLKHVHTPGARLSPPPLGTEESQGQDSALVPATVAANSRTELNVDEATPFRQGADWASAEAREAELAYVNHPRADAKVAAVLRQALGLQETLRALSNAQATLDAQRSVLTQGAAQVRQSLKAIEKSRGADALRSNLTRRLGELERKVGDVDAQRVAVTVKGEEARVKLQDVVRGLRVDEPLK